MTAQQAVTTSTRTRTKPPTRQQTNNMAAQDWELTVGKGTVVEQTVPGAAQVIIRHWDASELVTEDTDVLRAWIADLNKVIKRSAPRPLPTGCPATIKYEAKKPKESRERLAKGLLLLGRLDKRN